MLCERGAVWGLVQRGAVGVHDVLNRQERT